MRLKSILTAAILKTAMTTASLAVLACIASVPGHASTVDFTYNLTGGLTGPPVFIGTGLILDGLATGSFLTSNSGLNAAWSPASMHTHDTLDFATGQSTGIFDFMFADGDTLTGLFFEDDSAVLATNTGPFTEKLTITGGTGAFAGATGFATGGGVLGATGYTAIGSGTVSGPSVVPEPASVGMFCEGLLAMVAGRKLFKRQV